MSHNLLSAVGARLEALFNAKDTRVRSIEDSVKAQVSANPPAPFTLLPDGTKQFGYAPTAAAIDKQTAEAAAIQAAPLGAPQAENVSEEAAPIAALLSATARIFTSNVSASISAAPAEPKAVDPAPAQAAEPVAAQEASQPVVYSAITAAYLEAVFAKPAAPAAPTVEHAPTPTSSTPAIAAETPSVAPPAVTSSPSVLTETVAVANSPTLTATASATVAAATTIATVAATAARTSPMSAALGYTMLSDGTKQFGFAPTGGSINTAGVNKTPPVPTDFGVGATIRRKGVTSDTPMTVTRVGDGLVFAQFTDEQGTREMPFYPNQMDLLTAAP